MKNNKNFYDDYDDDDMYEIDLDWVDYDCDLNDHKTKDKVKWIATAVAFVLIAVIPLETSATFTYYIAASPELTNQVTMYNQHMSGCSLTVPNGYKKFAGATTSNVSGSKSVQMSKPDGYGIMYISAIFAAICPEAEKSKGTFSDEQFPFLLKAMDSLANNPGLTGENKYHFTVKVEAVVDGKTYTDIEKLYCGACTVIVTSVGIDTESIEF